MVLSPPNSDLSTLIPQRAMLVFRHGCTYRAQLESWLRDSGLRPAQILEFGTLEGILGCVRAGMGITLLPRYVVERLVTSEQLQLHPIDPQFGSVPTMLIRRQENYVSSALQAFFKLLESMECQTEV